MLSLVDASSRNTYRAEQSQVIVNQLQTEMEKIKRIPFEEVAMTAAPTHSTDPTDPSWRVSGNQFATLPNGTGLRPMVVNGGTLDGRRHDSGRDSEPGTDAVRYR